MFVAAEHFPKKSQQLIPQVISCFIFSVDSFEGSTLIIESREAIYLFLCFKRDNVVKTWRAVIAQIISSMKHLRTRQPVISLRSCCCG